MSIPAYYRSRVDKNQSCIFHAFERAGYSVFDTHRAGYGFPDLVVCSKGDQPIFVLFEVKSEDEGLTGKEVDFFQRTPQAPRFLIRTATEGLDIMRKIDNWNVRS